MIAPDRPTADLTTSDRTAPGNGAHASVDVGAPRRVPPILVGTPYPRLHRMSPLKVSIH